MLNYNEIKPKKYIVFNNEPYEVLSSHVFRKQQRKPVNQTKLKGVMSGKMIEHSFGVADKAEEAFLEKQNVKYLYNNRGEWWFSEIDNPSNRFKMDEGVIGDNSKFMKENSEVMILLFEEKPIGITVPVKMEFEVTEAPPNIKGNTAQGGNKPVKIETDAMITTPMFVETGDTIEVNTDTGEYVKRVT